MKQTRMDVDLWGKRDSTSFIVPHFVCSPINAQNARTTERLESKQFWGSKGRARNPASRDGVWKIWQFRSEIVSRILLK